MRTAAANRLGSCAGRYAFPPSKDCQLYRSDVPICCFKSAHPTYSASDQQQLQNHVLVGRMGCITDRGRPKNTPSFFTQKFRGPGNDVICKRREISRYYRRKQLIRGKQQNFLGRNTQLFSLLTVLNLGVYVNIRPIFSKSEHVLFVYILKQRRKFFLHISKQNSRIFKNYKFFY